MTKLDGDARGGALLSMRQVTGRPVKFLGVGEKIDQLEVFHPDRMAQRILDMGDVVSLVEKAAEEIDEKEAMKMAERMQSNKFDFNDMLQQMRMMKKLTSGGGMGGLLGMLPGMSKMKDAIGPDADKKMKHTEALILSMTPKERQRPEIINGQRRKRICNGAGRPVMEMNQLLKQFEMMKKMMKNQGAMMQMANAMMGGAGGGGGMGGMGGLGSLLGGLGGGGKMPKLPPGMKFPGKF
jgi:signal recognition particle subunit SRP54